MEYNISDEPNYGFKRKVSVAQIHIGFEDFVDKCVNLVLTVKYYENDDPPQNIYISFQVYMLGPKLTPSQFRSNIVPEGDITAVMTEYEFFISLMNVPIVISDIVQAKVSWADSLGRFN